MNEPDALENFVPSKILFANFYGKDVSFVWNEDTICILEYPMPDSFAGGVILTSPGKIKNILCLKNKIYLLCSPTGIYKISQDHKFQRISSGGIGIGLTFYQVFSPKENTLHYENKATKTSKPLFNISGDFQNMKFLHLYEDETHERLKSSLNDEQFNDSCLITNHHDLLCFSSEQIRIIHNCSAVITDVFVLKKDDKNFGIILLTDVNKIVVIHPRVGKLKTEQIYLTSQAKALCAGLCSAKQERLWIMYSDNEATYHLIKDLDSPKPATTLLVIEKVFFCFAQHKSKKISALTRSESDSVCMQQVSVEDVECNDSLTDEEDSPVKLNPDMMEEAGSMLEAIQQRVLDLSDVNDELSKQENLIRRINMYTMNQKIECIPRINVHTFSDRRLISLNFQKHLPPESQVVVSVCTHPSTQTFVVKKVFDSETVVELSILNEKIQNIGLKLNIDLIVVNLNSGPWWLIHDVVKDPAVRVDAKNPLKADKLNFLNNKKKILQKLIAENKIDMKTLSDIKKSIRRELPQIV